MTIGIIDPERNGERSGDRAATAPQTLRSTAEQRLLEVSLDELAVHVAGQGFLEEPDSLGDLELREMIGETIPQLGLGHGGSGCEHDGSGDQLQAVVGHTEHGDLGNAMRTSVAAFPPPSSTRSRHR